MFSLGRKAVQSAERAPAALRAGRSRYSTAQHGKTGDEVHHFAGSSTEHGHHHAGPKEESLGMQFYVVLAAIPLSIGLYTISRPSADGKLPSLSRAINSWNYYKERWAARNTAHTAMMEQVAFDKHLFQSTKGSMHVPLKFPETFNTGSPFNVVAGQGPRSMDSLVAHYEKLNLEDEERKAKKLAEK